MSNSLKHQRRPLGVIAGNCILSSNRNFSKNGRKNQSYKSESTLTSERTKQGVSIQSPNVFRSQQSDRESSSWNRSGMKTETNERSRRNSTTPKVNNINAAKRVHNSIANQLISHKNIKGNRSTPFHQLIAGLDPSPKRRPDPSTNPFSAQKGKMKSKNKKCDSVALSLGRLFKFDRGKEECKEQSGMVSTMIKKAKTIETKRSTESSDMDTQCSTSENEPPLVKPPYAKPDPMAYNAEYQMKESGPKQTGLLFNAKETSAIGVSEANVESSKNLYGLNKSNLLSQHLPTCETQEALNRSESYLPDDRRILEAMLNSCDNNTKNCIDTSLNDTAQSPLVGATVGGSTLRISHSVDESDVTVCVEEVLQQNIDSSININNAPSSHTFRRPNAQESERLSEQVGSQLQSGFTHHSQIHLPAGWQVRLSKSKGKPYYIHPDFGSTWHYPGLIIGAHIAVQNDIYSDQNFTVSRPTSNCTLKRSTETADVMQPTKLNQSSESDRSSNSRLKISVQHSDQSKENSLSEEAVANVGISSVSEMFGELNENSRLSNSSQFNRTRNESILRSVEEAISYDSLLLDTDNKDDHENEHISQTNSYGIYENCEEFGNEHRDELEELSGEILKHNAEEILSTINENHDESYSFISDHVDVDALLRQRIQTLRSPLASKREISKESSGCHSNNISPDDASFNNGCTRVQSSRNNLRTQTRLFDESSQISSEMDKAAIEEAHNKTHYEESVNDSDCYDQDKYSLFDNLNPISNENSETNDILSFKKSKTRRKATSRNIDQRKTFPPGPLCSLQMLDLIADGSLDTPMWRNGKRKRCTLTSLKRNRIDQNIGLRRKTR